MSSPARAPRCFMASPPAEDLDQLADRAVSVFQPCSSERLTRADGLEILEGLARYVRLLGAWDAEERQPAPEPVPDGAALSEPPPDPVRRGPGRRPRRAGRVRSPEYLP